jgi:alpha-ketoglutarate-dependent taurine dioxygenase
MSTLKTAVRIVSESAMPAGVRVTQLQPVLGSIVSGFRFDGRPLDDAFRSALRDHLHNRGLVIFEPGTVTAENFTAFAGFLGEFFHYAGPHTPRAPENPDATMIDSLKDKNLRNHIWHSDGGFRADARLSRRCLRSKCRNRAETPFSATRLGSTSSSIRCSQPILNP